MERKRFEGWEPITDVELTPILFIVSILSQTLFIPPGRSTTDSEAKSAAIPLPPSCGIPMGNVDFLVKNRMLLYAFRVSVLAMVYFGAVAKVELVWQMGDLSQALMVAINLVAIISLSGVAFKVLRDYENQLQSGTSRPTFARNQIPSLADRLPQNVWPNHSRSVVGSN